MKKRTLFLAVLLAATAALGFAGCETGSAENSIRVTVSGSSSLSPVMQTLAAEYEKTHKNVEISISTNETGVGIADTLSGKCEIGMASRALKASETGLDALKICDDGVVIIANNSAEVADVTSHQIYSLYANGTAIGSITKAVAREKGSGTKSVFDALIKNDKGEALEKVIEFSGAVSEQKLTGGVIAQIKSNANTLGYISLGSLNSEVKALNFEGKEATAANISSGEYKLSRPFNLLTKAGTALSSEAQDFLDFILSEAGQKIIADNGYIRLPA